MSRSTTPARVIADRRPVDHVTVNGRRVARGVEVTIPGRGRRNVRATVLGCVEHESGAVWVDLMTSAGFARTVHPDTIKVVHAGRRMGVVR